MNNRKEFSGLGELSQQYAKMGLPILKEMQKQTKALEKLTETLDALDTKWKKDLEGGALSPYDQNKYLGGSTGDASKLNEGLPSRLRMQFVTVNLVANVVPSTIVARQVIFTYETRRVRLNKLRYIINNMNLYKVFVSTERSSFKLPPSLWHEQLFSTVDPDTGGIRHCFEQDFTAGGSSGVLADQSLSVILEIVPQPVATIISGSIIVFYEE